VHNFDDGELTLAVLPRSALVLRALGLLFIGYGGYAAVSEPDQAQSWLIAAGLLIFGLWLAVRCPKARVSLTDTHARVHGFIWSRTVPRAGIRAVTSLPGLSWRTTAGARRWTPILFLSSAVGAPRWLRDYNEHAEAQLRRWVEHDGGQEPRSAQRR
jgi:hypothetical protein